MTIAKVLNIFNQKQIQHISTAIRSTTTEAFWDHWVSLRVKKDTSWSTLWRVSCCVWKNGKEDKKEERGPYWNSKQVKVVGGDSFFLSEDEGKKVFAAYKGHFLKAHGQVVMLEGKKFTFWDGLRDFCSGSRLFLKIFGEVRSGSTPFQF